MPRTPKHIEVYNAVKDAILSGRLGYGERLYNENWLCDTLHVSRATLRRAVEKLVDDGFLEHRLNKGFYVSYLLPTVEADPILTIIERIKIMGSIPSSKIQFFSRRPAGERFAEIFGIEPDEIVLETRRTVLVDSREFGVNHLVLVEKAFPEFNPWLLTNGILHEVLGTHYGVEMAKSVQHADAVLAPKDVATLLKIPLRTPILHTTIVESTDAGEAVEFQESWVNVDRIPYSLRINLEIPV